MKYFILNDSGKMEETDYKTFIYFVNEYGVTRNDKFGNTFWGDNNNQNMTPTTAKLPASQTIHAYNAHGYLIAEKVEV